MWISKNTTLILKTASCKLFKTTIRSESWWSSVELAPPDPIFGVSDAFKADSNPKKVLLGVGAYRTDEGVPLVLPSVRKAEEILLSKMLQHEYLPQEGLPEFNKVAASLAFGEHSCIIKNGLNVTVQSISGTGALRLGFEFLRKCHTGSKVVYLPKPTWGNHRTICEHAGLPFKSYTYYDPKTIGIDFCGMCDDIKNMPEKSIILFHAIAHNPTGCDPTVDQWAELSELCTKKNLFVFFDLAYQGFATGDTEDDAHAVRMFVEDGHKIALAQSFSKNMGLYGERVGACTILTASKDEASKVLSQMKLVIRSMYSNPPTYGARIVHLVLTDNQLKCQWQKDVKGMADRIVCARKMLVDSLKENGSQRDWSHIINQIGMFSFTGLTEEQVKKLAKEHSVYITADGRMSMASVGTKTADYVAKAIHDVTK